MLMNVQDFVYDTFLKLTSRTCPHGYEDNLVFDVMSNILPESIENDKFGNYFYKIGESKTIFASHIDTVSQVYKGVNHIVSNDGKTIYTDGKTTLGADDKAGMTVMLWMMKNKVPGLYYFFIGEEVGCIGSGLASKNLDFSEYDRIISFDRRGTDSIITYQSSGRCCSDEFAEHLSEELNQFGFSYKIDTGGVYTDSAEFMDLIPECTNVSVGYYKEHTVNEHQDIEHLINLSEACVLVDWENLITKRDPSKKEYKSFWSDHYDYDFYDDTAIDNTLNEELTLDDFYWDGTQYVRLPNSLLNDDLPEKAYYDVGDGSLIRIDTKPSMKDKYDWIVHKYAQSGLTWGELQIIKEDYLEIDNDYDRSFYEYLKDQLIDF